MLHADGRAVALEKTCMTPPTHFLWLSCTALIVSLFKTLRDGFKVAVFIWYVCRCLPQHSVSVQSPTSLLNSRFKTFFNFKQFPPSEFYIPSFLSWTRRLKSFPWDALVYGSIMAFYLGWWNKTKQNIRLLYPGMNPGLQSSMKFQCFNPRWKFNIQRCSWYG